MQKWESDYVEFTRTIAVYPKTVSDLTFHAPSYSVGVMYCLQGLCGELAELYYEIGDWEHAGFPIGTDMQSVVLDELGDVLWYLYRLGDEIDNTTSETPFAIRFAAPPDLQTQINYDALQDVQLRVVEVMLSACEMQNVFKKTLRDDDGKINPDRMSAMVQSVIDMMTNFQGLCNLCGYTLESVARRNREKLKSRQKRNQISGDGSNR